MQFNLRALNFFNTVYSYIFIKVAHLTEKKTIALSVASENHVFDSTNVTRSKSAHRIPIIKIMQFSICQKFNSFLYK